MNADIILDAKERQDVIEHRNNHYPAANAQQPGEDAADNAGCRHRRNQADEQRC